MLRATQSLLTLAIVVTLGACADGYDSPNGFDVGVSNQELTTPDSLTFTVNDDGTVGTITWPKVTGSAGYEVTMMNVDNPDSAYYVELASSHIIYDHYIVDGCTMTCDVQTDSKYTFQIKVVGAEKYNNKDGYEVDTTFSTLVPSLLTIPDGSDIGQYLDEHPLDELAAAYKAENDLDTITEIALDLEAGGHYTLSDTIDFRGYNMTFRGSKVSPAFITVTDKGTLWGYNGMKLKYLRIDMTDATSQALIAMSNTDLPESILSQNLGYVRVSDGTETAINNVYIMLNSVYLYDVWVKNLGKSLLNNNGIECAWTNLTIDNCIIQSCNSGNSASFIGFDYTGGGDGKSGRMIKSITLKNSTFYSTIENSSTYFLRYGNQSNANVQKTFGNATAELGSCDITFTYCTFSMIYQGQKWFNNINGTGLTGLFNHCIFYDLFQPFRRSMEKGGTWSCRFNFYYKPGTDSATDTDWSREDSSGNNCAAWYDPQFEGDTRQELDLEAENGGIDFTPGEYQIRSNNGGDLRWIE